MCWCTAVEGIILWCLTSTGLPTHHLCVPRSDWSRSHFWRCLLLLVLGEDGSWVTTNCTLSVPCECSQWHTPFPPGYALVWPPGRRMVRQTRLSEQCQVPQTDRTRHCQPISHCWPVSPQSYLTSSNDNGIIIQWNPLYDGHLWGTMFWPLNGGGLCWRVICTQTVTNLECMAFTCISQLTVSRDSSLRTCTCSLMASSVFVLYR